MDNNRNWKRLAMPALITFLLIIFAAFQIYKAATAPDTQCSTLHSTTSNPPVGLRTSTDYFVQGNHDYDEGNCKQAIADYTKSIELNPDYPQAYNNRAYTYMRMQDYQDALPDLDKAVILKPDYIQALMNRGDIYNYYYAIDRQKSIVDYKKVISLDGIQGTSVCGHLLLAKHNGWNLGTLLDIPQAVQNNCD